MGRKSKAEVTPWGPLLKYKTTPPRSDAIGPKEVTPGGPLLKYKTTPPWSDAFDNLDGYAQPAWAGVRGK